MPVKNDMWRVRINHVTVATVHIPGSDTDWALIGGQRKMIADADPQAHVSLVSEANEMGTLR